MHLNNLQIQEYKTFCEEMTRVAGKILLDYQNKFKVVNQKDIQDIATSADIASEEYIIKSVLDKYPTQGVLSEEKGSINSESEFIWIIDPLDGTKEYVRGIPQWNCSIALQYKNETVVACVYRPYENVMYSAGKDLGSFKNGEKIHVSDTKNLENSFVYCYIPSYKRNQDKYDEGFANLNKIGKKAYRLRALADENTALCWLASGGCEAYLNLSNPPKDHDILPGLLIAKEAGAFNAMNKIPLVVANNESVYNELNQIISI
jgi:myo-inositol-1(or 4)-monophosphatase